ncbi:MAG TPA: L-fucose mutarotase [Shigella sp.]|nr:L-fucose mutarotase [Shigella sp.]
MHKFTKALAAIGLAAVMSQSAMAENLKLGFLVKQPEEPWFQTEWKFADKAGKDLGFEVIKIAVPDGEKTLNAIDSLAASGAKGFVICTPDPKLGSAIVAKARGYDMKVIAVDDQFVNAKGKPMDTVPLVMMAAVEGDTLDPEVERRYRNALSLQAPCPDIIRINRFAFYERAQKAFAIVITGERAKYGNILLKKGVTP